MESLNENPPVVGVIVVNWNRKEDLLKCLSSIVRSDYQCLQIVLVDNASTDGSAGAVRQAYPQVTILELQQNLGFTGGNNTALRYLLSTSCEYYFLLNNDAVIDESTISILVSASRCNLDAGFLGPLILTSEKPDVILSAGGMLQNNWKAVQRGIGEINLGQYSDSEEVDYLSGCALLTRREVIEKIGLLDDDYFAYYEDVDWCRRAKNQGFSNLVVGSAKAWHPDTRLRDEKSPLVTYYIARNSILFARKQNLGGSIIASILLYYFRIWLSWTIKVKWRSKWPQRKALELVFRDILHHKVGGIDPKLV